MEKILAKIACPELDTELMENPPNALTWYFALTQDWKDRFAKILVMFSESSPSSVVHNCPSFGLLIETLVTRVGIPQEFIPHRPHCHSYNYLIKEGILDELRLASIIGTTPERAAQLNGAATQEEIEYYRAMKIDMPPNSSKPWARSQVKDLNEAVKSEVVPKLIESVKDASHTGGALDYHIYTDLGEKLAKTVNALESKAETIKKQFQQKAANIMSPEKDPMVHHPKHYTKGDIECIDAMASVVTGLEGMEAVHTANVIKYMWRWKDKNGLQDLEKAKWYLDKLIEKVKKEK